MIVWFFCCRLRYDLRLMILFFFFDQLLDQVLSRLKIIITIRKVLSTKNLKVKYLTHINYWDQVVDWPSSVQILTIIALKFEMNYFPFRSTVDFTFLLVLKFQGHYCHQLLWPYSEVFSWIFSKIISIHIGLKFRIHQAICTSVRV